MHRLLSSSPAESLSADGEEAHARPGRSMMGLSTRKEYNIYEEDELDAELLALGFESQISDPKEPQGSAGAPLGYIRPQPPAAQPVAPGHAGEPGTPPHPHPPGPLQLAPSLVPDLPAPPTSPTLAVPSRSDAGGQGSDAPALHARLTAVAADLRRFREEALVSAAHLIVLEQRARTSDPSLEHSYASSLSALAHIRAQWPTISPSLSRN